MSKLVKQGWTKAMISQRTLALILTLDDFLISGPHWITTSKKGTIENDPNILFVEDNFPKRQRSNEDAETPQSHVIAFYIMRPFIRGILYGLNHIYQISLFVPCDKDELRSLYKDIIQKIDIGGQFFEDRIYWNVSELKRDIMDRRLACLIYASNYKLPNEEWLKKIVIECKQFDATLETDLTTNTNLFYLVEMRSFLEEIHQKFFCMIKETKSCYLADMIRQYIDENGHKTNRDSSTMYLSGFYSATTAAEVESKTFRPYLSERFHSKKKNGKKVNTFSLFKRSKSTSSSMENVNLESLLKEYEEIIQEQLAINSEICSEGLDEKNVTKAICRWNSIILRKSDLLRILINQNNKSFVLEKLNNLNFTYYEKKYQLSSSDPDLRCTAIQRKTKTSGSSDNSCYLVISNHHDSSIPILENFSEPASKFSTWYTNAMKIS